MTQTVVDLEAIEHLDWQKPCDITQVHPLTVPPAQYVMHGLSPQPCGCVPPRNVVLLCRPCLEVYMRGIWFRCPQCLRRLWSPTSISKVTPL